jgi:hypothetical protein
MTLVFQRAEYQHRLAIQAKLDELLPFTKAHEMKS